MLTNWATIKKRIDRLKNLEEQEKNGNFEKFSKKEYSSQRKEMEKLKRLFKGIKEMTDLPDMVIFTNQFKDSLAIQECLRLGIPAICIVDTNCDPDLIPYPIPANDDSSSSITFILNYLVNRISLGYNRSELFIQKEDKI
jgi:small subunit ribosomal protein S2